MTNHDSPTTIPTLRMHQCRSKAHATWSRRIARGFVRTERDPRSARRSRSSRTERPRLVRRAERLMEGEEEGHRWDVARADARNDREAEVAADHVAIELWSDDAE